jgi:uncharacterized protein (DUF1697 family)
VIYLALLRGINVGGKNKVEMPRLRDALEEAGLVEVRTYINSGNVVFQTRKRSPTRLAALIEEVIETEWGFRIEVLVRDVETMQATADAIPPTWTDDATMRCYVMFLWADVDEPAVMERLTVKEIDDVVYVPGAIVWRVDRDVLTRSGMMEVTRDELYRSMTIRNVNTVRKLVAMMSEGV